VIYIYLCILLFNQVKVTIYVVAS